MATLILSSVGTALGGPIGGAVGALLGRAVDTAVIGRPQREGPRLTELAVSTSSYGQPVPRVFGTMRLPGTIIWATDLKETSQTSGAKGQAKTTSYSYSISFAVALSSRPISAIGRIWADGALLRGAGGDLKVTGAMRLHHGRGDSMPDPLIVADRGNAACAFRGLAYAVFEDLELGSFGNRIPALSFEIIGGDGSIDLVDLLGSAGFSPNVSLTLGGMTGYADAGGSRADLLGQVAELYPLMLTSTDTGLALAPTEPGPITALPTPIIELDRAGDFGAPTVRRKRAGHAPAGLRYYDAARDFQPSMQRAPGIAESESAQVIEFGGVFSAEDALARVSTVRRHALVGRETLTYRIDTPAPQFGPGRCVARDGDGRGWMVRSSETHAGGTDLLLDRVISHPAISPGADHGPALGPIDELPGNLALHFFELPWDGTGIGHTPRRYVAVSQPGTRSGVSLSAVEGSEFVPLGVPAPGDATMGETTSALGGSPSLVFEPHSWVEVQLASPAAQLQSVDERALLNGANRLLLGEEVLQFRLAEPVGAGCWQLTGLLRGRGGTEHHAAAGHPVGTPAVLLDQRIVALDAGTFDEIAAHGSVGDGEPAIAMLACQGASLRPLAPVHAFLRQSPSSDPCWSWNRRARGAWQWRDGVDVPLVEEAEAYRIGLGPVEAPVSQWDVAEPAFSLPAAEWSALSANHPGAVLWVQQVGSHAVSLPTRLPY